MEEWPLGEPPAEPPAPPSPAVPPLAPLPELPPVALVPPDAPVPPVPPLPAEPPCSSLPPQLTRAATPIAQMQVRQPRTLVVCARNPLMNIVGAQNVRKGLHHRALRGAPLRQHASHAKKLALTPTSGTTPHVTTDTPTEAPEATGWGAPPRLAPLAGPRPRPCSRPSAAARGRGGLASRVAVGRGRRRSTWCSEKRRASELLHAGRPLSFATAMASTLASVRAMIALRAGSS